MMEQHDNQYVIISHASQDKAAADKVCRHLEKAGIRCWIAPRDVAPGRDYAGQIMEAILGSAAMVLVLSPASNKSPHVGREVERAVSKRVPIIPFVIEPVKLSRSMEYYVSSQHWLEAADKPLAKHLPRLTATVKAILSERERELLPEERSDTAAGGIDQEAQGGAIHTDEVRTGQPAHSKIPWQRLRERRMALMLVIAVCVIAGVVMGVKYLGTPHAGGIAAQGQNRKWVTIMFFDNESSDTTLDWLQYGITRMIETDLEQDKNISVESPESFIDEFQKAGYPLAVKLPLPLIQDMMKRKTIRYFVKGSMAKTGGQYAISTTLYETKRCRIISQRSFSGPDIFNLVDEMSLDIKKNLGLSAQQIEDANDLPIAERLTKSLPAYRFYTFGKNAIMFGADYQRGIALLEKATQTDSTFAYAYWRLYDAYVNTKDKGKAENALMTTMKFIYRFYPNAQYWVKYEYYRSRDPDKVYDLCRAWVEQYPDDAQAHKNMGWLCYDREEYDKAIGQFKRAYELDPQLYTCLLYIGWCYKSSNADYDRSLSYLKQYAEKHNAEASPLEEIADVYKQKGDYGRARQYLQKASLMEPENIDIKLEEAELEREAGDLTAAGTKLNQVLRAVKNPKDSSAVYVYYARLHTLKGQSRAILDDLEKIFLLNKRYLSPFECDLRKLWYAPYYANAGETETAIQVLKSIENSLRPEDQASLWFDYAYVYLEHEDADKAEKAMTRFEECMNFSKSESWRSFAITGWARLFELRKDYPKAIQYYQQDLQKYPANIEDNSYAGRCYRLMGDLKKAEGCIKKAVNIKPVNPEYNYELAMVYADMGKRDKAILHLRRSLDIWAQADSSYQPAKKARGKLAELEKK